MSATNNKFSKLEWLKRTDGHKFKPAEFRVLISIYNHSDGQGRGSYPGLELMAKETVLTKSTVSEAVTALKRQGWIRETYKGNGLSGKNSVFELVHDAPNPPNGSAYGEPLEADNASAYAEPSIPNTSADTEPIVRHTPKPTDHDQILRSGHITDPTDLSIDGLIENPATVEPVTGSGPNEFDPFSTPLVDVIPLPEPIPARAQNTVPVLAWVEADGAPADEDGSTFDPFNDYETLNRAKRFILEECQGKGHEATNKALWWEFRQNFWSEMGPSGYLGQRLRLVEL